MPIGSRVRIQLCALSSVLILACGTVDQADLSAEDNSNRLDDSGSLFEQAPSRQALPRAEPVKTWLTREPATADCPSPMTCVVGHLSDTGTCHYERSLQGACATEPLPRGNSTTGICAHLQQPQPLWSVGSTRPINAWERASGGTHLFSSAGMPPDFVHEWVDSAGDWTRRVYFPINSSVPLYGAVPLDDVIIQVRDFQIEGLNATTLADSWTVPLSQVFPGASTAEVADAMHSGAPSVALSGQRALVTLGNPEGGSRLLWLSSTGSIQALLDTPARFRRALADENGTTFLFAPGSSSTRVTLAAYSSTGTRVWERGSGAVRAIGAPLAVWNGRLYLSNGKVLEAATGNELFTLPAGAPLLSVRVSPTSLVALAECSNSTESSCRQLLSFDPASGALRWRRAVTGWPSVSAPLLTNHDTVLLAVGLSWAAYPFDQNIVGALFEYSASGSVSGCEMPAQNGENVLRFLEGKLVLSAANVYRGEQSAFTLAYDVGDYDAPAHGWTMANGSPFGDLRAR